MGLLDRFDERNQRLADEYHGATTLLDRLSGPDRRRIMRAVSRGERLSTPRDARAALEAVGELRRNLIENRFVRWSFAAGGVLVAGDLIYSLATGSTWRAVALPVLEAVALAAFWAYLYLRLEPRLDAAERENHPIIEEPRRRISEHSDPQVA